MPKKKQYSFEILQDPRTWASEGGKYVADSIPTIRFRTDNIGFQTLHEGFQVAEEHERLITDYERAKKGEAARKQDEELALLRDSVNHAKDSFKKLEQLSIDLDLGAKGPSQTVVPKFEHYPGCPRKAIATWSPPTAGLLSAQGSLITGVAVTDEVNRNGWRLKTEDLGYVAEKLIGRQLRLRHTDSPRDVIGKILETKLHGNRILFKAEIDPGEKDLIRKIERKYLDAVSIQVLARQFICSVCGGPTRDEVGRIIHKCEDAHEIVEGPEPLEISLVTEGAYDQAVITEVAS